MSFNASSNVYITNLSACLPNPPVSNDEMERVLGQVGERPSRARRTVVRSNGIKKRYYAIDPMTLQPNFTNASLTAAAVRALEGQDFTLKELQCLVCGTSIADQLIPNHAVMVQGELQLPACEVIATAGVCLSGMSALKYAYMAICSGIHRNAIATGSELSSAVMHAHNFSGEAAHTAMAQGKRADLAFDKDFLRWMLSDGAGAALLRPQPGTQTLSLRIDWIDFYSYAGEMEVCMYAGAEKQPNGRLKGWAQFEPKERARHSVMAVTQDIKLLNDNIIHYTVGKPLRDLQRKRDLYAADIDYFLPHYSSNFFRDKLYAGLHNVQFDIPQDRWFTNLTEKGNTGSASIYIMLEELFHSGRLRAGQKLLCYVPESGRFSTAFMHLTVV